PTPQPAHLSSSYFYADDRHLHSFPTRRSSDMSSNVIVWVPVVARSLRRSASCVMSPLPPRSYSCHHNGLPSAASMILSGGRTSRSEEHTSELQSRENLVCRLLLEKKKKTILTP